MIAAFSDGQAMPPHRIRSPVLSKSVINSSVRNSSVSHDIGSPG